MNGDTMFIEVQKVPLLSEEPREIWNTRGNIWRVITSEGDPIILEAPDLVGEKPYGVSVDDVSLFYNPDKRVLVWSVSWSHL